MRCEHCGKEPAAVHLSQNIQGVRRETHLCESCARQAGYIGSGSSTADFLSQLFGLVRQPSQQVVRGQQCPGCGMTMEQFGREGRLGCEQCYQQFSQQLQPLLRRLHGQTEHVGMRPEVVQEKAEAAAPDDLQELRRQLAEAIRQEEYETAAALRDQIRRKEGLA